MRGSEPVLTRVITIFAWLSLFVAFLIGHFAAKPNYVQLLQAKFPSSSFTQTDQITNNSDAFMRNQGGTEPQLILLAEGQGFGGPMTVAIAITATAENLMINKITLLADRETPPFLARLTKQQFFNEFDRKIASDNFVLGDDIDGVSGATITVKGITKAVQAVMHETAIVKQGENPPLQTEQWPLQQNDLLLILLIAAVFYSHYAKNTFSHKLKQTIPYISLVFIGFYLNASLSIASLATLAIGYIPDPRQFPIWWIMMGSVLAAIVLLGTNIYCNKLCPFSTIQMLLHKISGLKFAVNKQWSKNAQRLIMSLTWLSLMLMFISHHPAMGAYEPFSMMFSLEGMGMQWYILPLSLLGALFIPDFWCRFFCPLGYSLNAMVRTRRKLGHKLTARKSAKAQIIQVQAAHIGKTSKKRKQGS